MIRSCDSIGHQPIAIWAPPTLETVVANMVKDMLPLRSDWPIDFPNVAVHTTEKARNAHQDFAAAKSGEEAAADRLIAALVDEKSIAQLAVDIGDRCPVLVPVRAIEADGINEIPEAMAEALSIRLSLDYQTHVLQSNIVRHTKATAAQRINNQAIFEGDVESGLDYYLIDDHLGLGGTLASLKGFLESEGGRVIGATVLTSSRNNTILSLNGKTLGALRTKYGPELEKWWQDRFGHGFQQLTEPEAQWLIRGTDADGVRKKLAADEGKGEGAKNSGASGGGGLNGPAISDKSDDASPGAGAGGEAASGQKQVTR